MALLNEFKEFINRGNVVDLAVGVVIGAAFGKIVTSFVDDLLMPLMGQATGGVNFSDLKVVLSPAVLDAAGKVLKPENAFRYGNFIQVVVDFLIIAVAIFLLIKAVNRMRRVKEVEVAAPPALPAQEALLTEIRDILRSDRQLQAAPGD